MPTTADALEILELFRTSSLPIDQHTREYLRAVLYRTQAYTQINSTQRAWILNERIIQ